MVSEPRNGAQVLSAGNKKHVSRYLERLIDSVPRERFAARSVLESSVISCYPETTCFQSSQNTFFSS